MKRNSMFFHFFRLSDMPCPIIIWQEKVYVLTCICDHVLGMACTCPAQYPIQTSYMLLHQLCIVEGVHGELRMDYTCAEMNLTLTTESFFFNVGDSQLAHVWPSALRIVASVGDVRAWWFEMCLVWINIMDYSSDQVFLIMIIVWIRTISLDPAYIELYRFLKLYYSFKIGFFWNVL